jgi:hypothetical protein
VLAFASATSAVTIPAGLPEGNYIVTVDESGNGNHDFTLIDNVPSIAPSTPNRLKSRQDTFPSSSGAKCSGDRYLNSNDFYNGAWDKFYNACNGLGGQTIGNGKHLATYNGDSVAFMCSYANNPCSAKEWSIAVERISGACSGRSGGTMQAGYYNVPEWKKVSSKL